jgi:hypothetical protein
MALEDMDWSLVAPGAAEEESDDELGFLLGEVLDELV